MAVALFQFCSALSSHSHKTGKIIPFLSEIPHIGEHLRCLPPQVPLFSVSEAAYGKHTAMGVKPNFTQVLLKNMPESVRGEVLRCKPSSL